MSIGESLADARHRAGLTVSQVSQQTRIRESIIRDIEQGDFDTCGGDFYARGHIRSIAGAVGADPVPLISEYDADHGPVSPLRAAEVFEPTRPIKIRERHSPSLAMIVILFFVQEFTASNPGAQAAIQSFTNQLVWKDQIFKWSPGGYQERRPRPKRVDVSLLTPPSTVAAIRAGYTPEVHASAAPQKRR